MAAPRAEPTGTPARLTIRPPAWGAMALGAIAVGLAAVNVSLGMASHLSSRGENVALIPVVVPCLVVGVLLAARRPDNAMGWCLLGAAVFLVLSGIGSSYSVLDYRVHHGAYPLGWVAVLLAPGWAPGIFLFVLSFLLFPDGHFSSRLTKWLTGLVAALGAMWMAGAFGIAVQAMVAHAVHVAPTGTLFAINHPPEAWAWWSVVQYAFFTSIGVTAVVWFAQQVPRFRRANQELRHQMKWLLSGAGVTIVGGIFSGGLVYAWVGVVGTLCLAALPLSIAVGVTKFRLYDIDRLIIRTLSYVLLTGVVVGVYFGVVTLTTRAIGFSSSVGVAASTLIAAALFNPLRKRLQRVVDRRFNRARYDAQRTLSAFSARLRDAVDPDTVERELIDVLHAAFEPVGASVWLRPPPLTAEVAAAP